LINAVSKEDVAMLEQITRSHGQEGGPSHGDILLVEDNKMNQLLGSKILSKLGYRFDIANHGGEAVQALMLKTYDVILMDCQMPEMDGYEATAHIRRLEGSERHTPIIAMTAAAMEGDREKCLDAGMDDYISKPVRPDAIKAMIERWLEQSKSVVTTLNPSLSSVPSAHNFVAEVPARGFASSGSEPRAALDPGQIGLLRGLDDGEGMVLLEVIEQYLEQAAAQLDAVVSATQTGDAIAIERAAHSLRGSSSNVGAWQLAEVSGKIEASGRGDDIAGAQALLTVLDEELARVRVALSEVVARA
jgi:CheY-like chemotaxis protein/HPt (histidine-containing phosphotransfer) domain-containing protein